MKKLVLFLLCGLLVYGDSFAQGRGRGHDKHSHHKHGHHNKHVRHNSPGHRVVHRDRYMKARPLPPRYVRTTSPHRGYIYIEDDWRWDTHTNAWVWYGNRWVPAPAAGQVWVPGSWVQLSVGWTWNPGRWR